MNNQTNEKKWQMVFNYIFNFVTFGHFSCILCFLQHMPRADAPQFYHCIFLYLVYVTLESFMFKTLWSSQQNNLL